MLKKFVTKTCGCFSGKSRSCNGEVLLRIPLSDRLERVLVMQDPACLRADVSLKQRVDADLEKIGLKNKTNQPPKLLWMFLAVISENLVTYEEAEISWERVDTTEQMRRRPDMVKWRWNAVIERTIKTVGLVKRGFEMRRGAQAWRIGYTMKVI